MTEKEQIEQASREVIGSKTLSKSQYSQQLLAFLVKATLDGRDVKEYTIASEVFNKESDTGVRAYIHNLRKKLAEYYSGEGANSELIFTIPKGQYYIRVQKRRKGIRKLTGQIVKKPAFKRAFLILIFLVVAFSVVFVLFGDKNVEKPQDTLVWKDIMKSEMPLLIVIGDHYFYGSEVPTGQTGIIRDFTINSEADLDEWLDKNTFSGGDSIFKINYTYTTKEGVRSIFKISQYMEKPVNAKTVFSSELVYEQLKNNNILFIGKYNTMGILQTLVDSGYFHLERRFHKLNYFTKDSTIEKKISLAKLYKEDYPVVLKFKTPYDKTIMMFVCGDDPGMAASLDYFLETENLLWLEQKLALSKDGNLFSALFKVEGLERTDFSIAFISGEKITGNHNGR